MQIQLTIGGKTARSKYTPMTVDIGFNSLPDASKEFIIRYGLKQYLADGVAGAADQKEFDDGVKDRMNKLISGDLTRAKGEAKVKTDSLEGRTRKLIRDDIRQRAKAANLKLEAEKLAELVGKVYDDEAKRAPYATEAKRQLDNEAKLQTGGDDLLTALGLDLSPVEAETPADA